MHTVTVDAILIYAQSGHGRRANLYTDFTFAVYSQGGDLLPFTKAYSGLTDKEFIEINQWIKKNTLERFGPVRKVTAELVFEIAFEGIQESKRHKSGIALRFPRMVRWRKDKVGFEPPQKNWMENKTVQEGILEARKKLVNENILKSEVLQKPIQPKASHDADNYDWRYFSAASLFTPTPFLR